MQKNIRRKNLAFRPAGEDTLHDKAVAFLDQIGRGQSDFVASAVVYYAMMLSEGKIEKEHVKQLSAYRIRAKIVAAPTLATSNTYPVKDIKGKETSSIKDQTQSPAVQSGECDEIFEVGATSTQSPDVQAIMIDSQESVNSTLPDDILKSLLNGFKIR